MRSAMSWIKVFLLNIFITFSLLGFLLFLPPVVYFLVSLWPNSNFKNSSIDARAGLDIYSEFKWADSHFNELSQLNTRNYDFISWRRDDFAGETVTVSNNLRSTIAPINCKISLDEYYFFGGSTTWGHGVNDENTYPSIFAQRLNTPVVNFGESGYIARQSLAFLNNFLIEKSMSDLSGRHIVFYDGVNDVYFRCRNEITRLGTGREIQIQNILSKSSSEKYSFEKLFEQLTQFLKSVTIRLSIHNAPSVADDTYGCSSNSERAEEVAMTLVEAWQLTSDLVKQRGGKFTAILQPVALTGKPNIEYLDLNSSHDLTVKMQYEAVYPLIRQYAVEKNFNFIDLSSAYDNCDNCYIDFCHVGPQAHQILVDKLVSEFGI